MGANNKRRANARAEERAKRKIDIAKQYGVPMSALANSQPAPLGRSMFLTPGEAKRFKTVFGKARRGEGLPEYLLAKEGDKK